MDSKPELTTSEFSTEQLEPGMLEVPVDTPAGRSVTGQIKWGIIYFFVFVLGFGIYTVAGKWAVHKANKSSSVADWCLWVAGSDMTWEEYQKKQIDNGNPRLRDKELGWVGQLVQDAYAGNRLDDNPKNKQRGR